MDLSHVQELAIRLPDALAKLPPLKKERPPEPPKVEKSEEQRKAELRAKSLSRMADGKTLLGMYFAIYRDYVRKMKRVKEFTMRNFAPKYIHLPLGVQRAARELAGGQSGVRVA